VARDAIEVVRVVVALRDSDGAVVRLADATAHGGVWRLAVPPPGPGAKPATHACITAFDRPGNFAIREFPLP
jgi:hypothetical protein